MIETYFAPLGNVVKGSTRYDEAEVQKRAVRVAFLANILSFSETYPDVSNLGRPDTNAMPNVWANRQDFERRLRPEDLLLVPPCPQDMGILDWHRHTELMDNTYRWGMREVARLRAEGRHLALGAVVGSDRPPATTIGAAS